MRSNSQEWAFQEGPGVLWARGALIYLSTAADAPAQALRLENSSATDLSSALDVLLAAGFARLDDTALAYQDAKGLTVLFRGKTRVKALSDAQMLEEFHAENFRTFRQIRFNDIQQLQIEIVENAQNQLSASQPLTNGTKSASSVGFDNSASSAFAQAHTMPLSSLDLADIANADTIIPQRQAPADSAEAADQSEAILVLPDGTRISLSEQMLIGRSPHLSRVSEPGVVKLVRVDSASRSLSRNHAILTLTEHSVILSDANSTNGTSVWHPKFGMQQLQSGESIELNDDCVIRLAGKIDLHLLLNGEKK